MTIVLQMSTSLCLLSRSQCRTVCIVCAAWCRDGVNPPIGISSGKCDPGDDWLRVPWSKVSSFTNSGSAATFLLFLDSTMQRVCPWIGSADFRRWSPNSKESVDTVEVSFMRRRLEVWNLSAPAEEGKITVCICTSIFLPQDGTGK